MQITFDTSNPQDLIILQGLMSLSLNSTAQPEVAQNTGTTATGVDLSPEGSGVDEGTASAVAPVTEKPKRVKKEKVEEPVVATNSVVEPEAPVEQDNAKPLTLDEVRAALQAFTASKGVPAGIELLKEFEAGRISELAAEKYAAFVERCAA